MLIMERDWTHRGHPQHDTSASSTALPTLPSVAELIASSRPASSTIPAYHHRTPSSPLPPILGSTPHSQAAPANAQSQAPSEHSPSYFDAARYTSHASPTNSATSTTPSERHHYQQPSVQPAATQGATSEGYHGLQDAAHSQAPINSRRQDSAIAQYRNETSKESSSFAPSEPDVFYSRRSPNDRHLSDSPRLTSHFVPHSSGPSASHHPTTSPRFSEHVTPAATNYHETGINPSSRSAAATGAPDHASPGTTRQQRYNVRFAVNYSSTNMPPTQRPRPSSPLPAATMAHAEPVESLPVARIESSPPPAEDTAPRVERMPKPDAISMILGQRRSPAPSTSSVDVPVQSADRCPGCHDVYKAPPAPSMTEWSQQEPAKNAMDYAKATEGFFALQRENAKAAADDYQTWREKHTRCPVPRGLPPTHTTSNGATNGHSNKRKNDVPHDDTARPRRTTFDSHATSATPVRPTAPAV